MDDKQAPARGAKAKTRAAKTTQREAPARVRTEKPKKIQTGSPNSSPGKQCDGRRASPERSVTSQSVTNPKEKRGRAKSARPPPEEMTELQTSNNTTTRCMTAGPQRVKASSAAKLVEENIERVSQHNKNDIGIPSVMSTGAKTCDGKPSLPPSAEKAAKDQPSRTSAETTTVKKCAAKTKSKESTEEQKTPDESGGIELEEKKAVDSVLKETLEGIRMKMNEISSTSEAINDIIKQITKHMKEKSICFKNVADPLRTGSYYEKLKISRPDEFDVMMPMPVERVQIEPFGDDGAFYSVALQRGNNHLKKFQKEEKLLASQMLSEFREEVKKCMKEFPWWTMDRKKPGCPAVTMTTVVDSVTISLDVVLSLVVKSSWPPFTKDGMKVERWLGKKVRKDHKLKPYYLVPKYEGKGNAEKDGVFAKDTWRVSFSHVEKAILMNHGSKKTCCEGGEARCCRKDCLKLLKNLLSLLKEEDKSFDKFYSYQAKTTLLHACCTRVSDTEWEASDLSQCFQQLLQDFEGHLESGVLPNFFIPSQNLLHGANEKACRCLAARLKEERCKGFPIFKQQLSKTH